MPLNRNKFPFLHSKLVLFALKSWVKFHASAYVTFVDVKLILRNFVYSVYFSCIFLWPGQRSKRCHILISMMVTTSLQRKDIIFWAQSLFNWCNVQLLRLLKHSVKQTVLVALWQFHLPRWCGYEAYLSVCHLFYGRTEGMQWTMQIEQENALKKWTEIFRISPLMLCSVLEKWEVTNFNSFERKTER